MELTVEKVKKYTKVSQELLQELQDFITAHANSEVDLMEDFVMIYDGKNYSFEQIGESPWDDQGKYQYQDIDYILKDENGNYMNILAKVGVIRSGSYFSDYYYEYDVPTLYIITTKTEPEVIIPEHEVVIYEQA